MHEERLKSVIGQIRRIRHDANGPLTVALGHLQLLLEDSDRIDPDVTRSLRVVESELQRLIRILRGLDGLQSEPAAEIGP